METLKADIGMWPGVLYLLALVVAVLTMWRWDMRRQRKARRDAERIKQHISFLTGRKS
jgi:hypothetical protein